MLLGITQRCGTNYLYKVLGLHEDVQKMSFSGEDFLLNSASYLGKYVYKTSANWHSMWGGGMDIPALQTKLASGIGQGLLSDFLLDGEATPHTHLLSKTPDTRGVEWAPYFFPNTKIIFLVRNPVDNIESGKKSFGWTYREGSKRWKASAQRILRMAKNHPDNTMIVRYEELMKDKESTVSKLLEFAGLRQEGLEIESLDQIKLLGSSSSRNRDGKIDWSGENTQPEPAHKNPVHSMPAWLKASIVRRCMPEYQALGYEKLPKNGNIGILALLKQSRLALIETAKDSYRTGLKALTAGDSSYKKWCKKLLGLEIETLS